jgi:DsbC/DsbD-like thiol-disulfide interchange protein
VSVPNLTLRFVLPIEQDSDSDSTITELMKKVQFHKPGENFKTDGYVIHDKTTDLLKQHLKETDVQSNYFSTNKKELKNLIFVLQVAIENQKTGM